MVPGCERVASVWLFDNANGSHQFAYTDDQTSMIARAWFLSIFTHGGKDDAERACDLDELGTTGHGISFPPD